MELKRFLEIKENLKKGTNYKFVWVSDVKTLKNAPMDLKVIKMSNGVARFGIDYTHTKTFKIKNLEEPTNSGGLPFGEWDIFPWLIKHNGEYYVRAYVSSFETKTKRKFFKNDSFVGNVELSKEELQTMVNDKVISSTTLKPSLLVDGVFVVKLKNIISINGEC